jgi:predicted Zn finger-like uncharacterized protein
MLTRCPSCQTVFRLSQEQLNARQGKVRCGHCFNPFNALDYLVAPQDEELPQPTSARQAPARPAPAAGTQTSHAPPPPVGLTVEPTRPPVDLNQAMRDNAAATAAAGKPHTPPPVVKSIKAKRTLDALDFSSSLDSKPKVARALAWSPAAEFPDLNTSTDADAQIVKALTNEDDSGDDPGAADDASDVIEAIELDPDTGLSADAPARGDALIRSRHGSLPDGRQEPSIKTPLSAAIPHAIHSEPPIEVDLDNPIAAKINLIEYEFNNYDDKIEFDNEADVAPATGVDADSAAAEDDAEEDDDAEESAIPKIDPERLNAYGKPTTRASRIFWGGLVFVLGVTLALQSTYLFRHEIAREVPGLRPWLIMACAEIGCDMPLPRDPGFIKIVDSDLQSYPGHPGHYVFFATISNRAGFAQDWPSLELTLSDGIDTPLARRVITPEEWVTRERIGSGFAPRSDLSVRLLFEVNQIDPSNYHVDSFYP